MSASAQQVAAGRQLRLLSLGGHAGAAMPGIIDPLGRVFEPHPYNVPQYPWAVAHFSAQMLLMMIDTSMINGRILAGENDKYRLQALLRQVRDHSWMESHMSDQPPPHADDGPWVLYQPDTVREYGKKFDRDLIYRQKCRADEELFPSKPPHLAKGHRLVAVVKVSPEGLEPWTVAFDASSPPGYHQLSTIQPSQLYGIELFSVPELRLKKLEGPPPPFA